MQISIFLAKFLAIYFLIVSIPMLLNTKAFKHRAQAFIKDDGLMLIGSIMALILGIFFILFHSIWVYDWRLVVTLIAWLTFIKGAVFLLYPDAGQHLISKMNNEMAYRISGLFCLFLAIYLGYHGFGF